MGGFSASRDCGDDSRSQRHRKLVGMCTPVCEVAVIEELELVCPENQNPG